MGQDRKAALLDVYAQKKAQLKALTAEVAELQKEVIDTLEINEGSAGACGNYTYTYNPMRRYSFNTKKARGMAGLIKREFGEELLWTMVRFDHKDFVPFKAKFGKKLDEFFDCKISFSLRVKEIK